MEVLYRPWIAFFVGLLALAASRALSDDGQGLYQRGEEELHKGNFLAAAKLLDEAVTKSPLDARARRCCAFARVLCGQPERATKEFGVAIQQIPTDAVLYYGRGCAYQLLGKTSLALNDLSEAIRRDPAYTAAYEARSALLYDSGDVARFLADLERANHLREKGCFRRCREPSLSIWSALISAPPNIWI